MAILAGPHGQAAQETVQLRVRVLTFYIQTRLSPSVCASILCPTYAAEHAPCLGLCPELPGEGGRHPGLEARLPVQVGGHHVALQGHG